MFLGGFLHFLYSLNAFAPKEPFRICRNTLSGKNYIPGVID